MKSKLLISLLVCLLSFGCASTPEGMDRWATLATVLARRGTYEAVKANPSWRGAFEVVSVKIDQLILNDQIDAPKLLAALQLLPIRELKGDEGALIILDAIDLYDGLIRDTLRLPDDKPLVKKIALNLRNGIRAGLYMAQPRPLPPIPPTSLRPEITTNELGHVVWKWSFEPNPLKGYRIMVGNQPITSSTPVWSVVIVDGSSTGGVWSVK